MAASATEARGVGGDTGRRDYLGQLVNRSVPSTYAAGLAVAVWDRSSLRELVEEHNSWWITPPIWAA